MRKDGPSLRRFQRLTSVAFGATNGRAPKGKRLSVQYKRQRGPGSRVLCRTLAFPRKAAILPRLRRRWEPDNSTHKTLN